MMKRITRGEVHEREMPTLGRILVSREDAAQTLGLSLRTIDRAIERGDLAAKRYGRRVLVPAAEIGRYLEKLDATGQIKSPPE
jgi:excisionase family DNA binding protein